MQDRHDEAGAASPFRSDAPMREASPSPGTPALEELLSVPGIRLSGLNLEDGAVIVKVEHGGRVRSAMRPFVRSRSRRGSNACCRATDAGKAVLRDW